MQERSDFTGILVIVCVLIMIVLQVMTMIQSDRLYRKLNDVAEQMKVGEVSTLSQD